jgi:hypothetical protein
MLFLNVQGMTINFANSTPCTWRGSSGQRPKYGLTTLTYQLFTDVLLLIYGSVFLSGVYYCLAATQGSCITTKYLLTRRYLWGSFFASKQITVLEHPPCLPDLASSDFILFPKIKYWKEGIFMTLMTSGVIRRRLWRPLHKTRPKTVL